MFPKILAVPEGSQYFIKKHVNPDKPSKNACRETRPKTGTAQFY